MADERTPPRPSDEAIPVIPSGPSATGAARANILLLPIVAIAGVASVIVLARVLTVAEFALYAIAIAIRVTMQYLVDLGTGSAASRLFAELHAMGARRQAIQLYWRLLIGRGLLVALIAAVIVAFPGPAGDVLSVEDHATVFLAFAIGIAVVEIAGLLAFYVLSALYAQRASNTVSLMSGVLQPVLVSAAALAGWGIEGILGAVLISATFRSGGFITLAFLRLRAMPESGETHGQVRETLTRVTVASMVSKAAAWLHSRPFLTLLAASQRPRAELAAFALVHDICQQSLTAATAPASGIVLPAFSRAGSDPVRQRALFRMIGRLTALLVWPVTAALVVLAADAVPLALGERYADAVDFAYLIAPALALEITLAMPSNGFALTHDDLLRPFVVIRVVAIVAALAYVALSPGPLIVAAAWMMFVRVAGGLAVTIMIAVRTGVTADGRSLARLAAVTVVAAGAGGLMAELVTGHLAAITAAGTVMVLVYLGGLRALRALHPDDVAAVIRVLPRSTPIMSRLARVSR